MDSGGIEIGCSSAQVICWRNPEGYEDTWDEVAGWMVASYKECAKVGEQYGVKIGIQNHGDMLQTADQYLKVLEAMDSEWVGLIVDTGSFLTKDPYTDIEQVTPYTINWQVKESPFGIGNKMRTDFNRLVEILYKKSYAGYLPVETLMDRNKP